MTDQITVGRVDGTGEKHTFTTTAEAETFVGTVLTERDPDGVKKGDYYIDAPESNTAVAPEKNAVTIRTNNHDRQFVYRCDVPADVLKSEFDWTDDNEDDYSDGFFQYRGSWYHMGEFMNCGKDMFPGWDGYHGDTFFSGIVIKVSDDGETYRVGTYMVTS